MEIEKKFSREANAETNSTVDLFFDKSTNELKFLDRYKKENTLAGTATPKFKIVTGFYAQSNSIYTSGELVIGQTYYISVYGETDDFSNVGAELNEIGQTFVATGTTPTDWSNGSELINVEESKGILEIFDNTLGTITAEWADGSGYLASEGLFTNGKTWKTPDVPKANIALGYGDDSTIYIIGVEEELSTGCSFEIRVYN
jgi:hypothetical protein